MPDKRPLFAILCALIISSISQALYFEPPTCDTVDQHFSMFPASNPTTFYVCLPDGNPKLVACDAGQVFVDTSDVYGCAPYSMSPCGKTVQPIDCAGADRDSLARAEDPQHYWICAAPNGTPTQLPCPANKGFVKNSTHMGCIDWVQWSC